MASSTLLKLLAVACLVASVNTVPVVKKAAPGKKVAIPVKKAGKKVVPTKKVLPVKKAAPVPKPCPKPLDYCNLYFAGFKYKTPKFAVWPDIGNRLMTKAGIYTKEDKYVETLSTSGCSVWQQPGTRCKGFVFLPPDPNTNITKYLGTHPMTSKVAKNVQSKCIVLRIDNYFVDGVGWVNYGDYRPGYPENRRCMVFQT